MASRHDDRLSDFTTNSRLLILVAMAVAIGVMSSLVAYALVWLIGVATNLVWYHRYSSVLTSPAKSALGVARRVRSGGRRHDRRADGALRVGARSADTAFPKRSKRF